MATFAPVPEGEHRGHASRRADIQGLRALAVALVVAFHADLPVPGGYVGVDLFFVISGFVIGAMLLRQFARTGGLSFGGFYTRRARRLLPALALLTTVTALAAIALLGPLGPQRQSGRTGIAASLFSANIQLSRVPGGGYFDLSTDTNAFLHTWSLSVEEQFYLLFPAFLLVSWKLASRVRGWSRRGAFALVAVATLASFALSTLTTMRPSARLGTTFAFYSALSRAWEFGAGVLLAIAAPRLARLHPAAAAVSALAGAGLVAYAALAFDGQTEFPGVAALVPVIGAVLLIAAGQAGWKPLVRTLSVRPAVWVGDVSYGWYLWHWPFIVFATALWPGRPWVLVVAALAALLPTAASYRWLENPVRFDDRIVGRRVLALAAVCILVPIAACVGLLAANRALRSSDEVTAYATAMRLHADRVRGCDQPTPIAARTDTDRCTWTADRGAARGAGPVYLVGDSNAGQFTEPVVAAARAEGHDVTVATSAGCPLVDVGIVKRNNRRFDTDQCLRSTTASRRTLAERKPALVVLAASSAEYVGDPSIELRDPLTGERSTDEQEKAAIWERGVNRVVTDLAEAGVPSVVVKTIPQLGTALGDDWKGEVCPAVQILRKACGGSGDRAAIAREQAPADRAEERAVADVPESTTAEVADVVCSPTRCATYRDGRWIYRDATHLTVDGAELLTDRFAQVIRSRARPTG